MTFLAATILVGMLEMAVSRTNEAVQAVPALAWRVTNSVAPATSVADGNALSVNEVVADFPPQAY